jgi:hypothetical protein
MLFWADAIISEFATLYITAPIVEVWFYPDLLAELDEGFFYCNLLYLSRSWNVGHGASLDIAVILEP